MSDENPAWSRPRDIGFTAIIVLLAFNAIWLLLMPLVPAIASATLHRFHLRSGSFLVWAIQQPIPSMYNFANRFQLHESADGFSDSSGGEPRYINHFPMRVVTFANRRYRYLRDGKDHWFTVESTYRGQTIVSRFHLQPTASGGFRLIRMPVKQDASEKVR